MNAVVRKFFALKRIVQHGILVDKGAKQVHVVNHQIVFHGNIAVTRRKTVRSRKLKINRKYILLLEKPVFQALLHFLAKVGLCKFFDGRVVAFRMPDKDKRAPFQSQFLVFQSFHSRHRHRFFNKHRELHFDAFLDVFIVRYGWRCNNGKVRRNLAGFNSFEQGGSLGRSIGDINEFNTIGFEEPLVPLAHGSITD